MRWPASGVLCSGTGGQALVICYSILGRAQRDPYKGTLHYKYYFSTNLSSTPDRVLPLKTPSPAAHPKKSGGT